MNDGGLLNSLRASLGPYAPKLVSVLALGLGGLLLSWMLSRAAVWLMRRSGLEALLEKAGIAKVLYGLGWKDGATPVVRSIVWYGGLLATGATVAEGLGLTGLQQGIASILAFLPKLASGVAVIMGGLWLAGVARGLADKLSNRGSEPASSAAGQVAYGLVLALSVTVALDQLGLRVELLSSLLQIGVGAVVFAMALAFALGGRSLFENLLARHYYNALVSAGDRIKVGEVEGVVVRLTPVAVILATAQGERVIPCATLLTGVTEIRRLGQGA